MDFADNADQAAFRADLVAWLDERLPLSRIPEADDERTEYLSRWHSELFRGGWVGVSFTEDWGGRGLPEVYEAIVLDELAKSGAPSGWRFGYVAGVIEQYGSVEQKQRYIPSALSGEHRWCQGFSEPDAGSDLASIRTSAEPRHGSYVVSGQKVWTSEAHLADFCLLLARTDPNSSRHHGLSCFVVPTEAPGLTVRPFRQITGSLEFAELFFDDVEIPADQMIGNPGQGWAIAMSTVSAERGPADVGFIADLQRTVSRMEQLCTAGELVLDDARRMALARAAVEVEVLRTQVLTSLSRRDAGLATDTDTSIDKLLLTWVEQGLAHAVLDAVDTPCLVGSSVEAGSEEVRSATTTAWRDYLWSRAASVYGGTEQIQKTIVATRILGLPK